MRALPDVENRVMLDSVDESLQRRRLTFDSAADRYQQARPAYPTELFDALVDATGVVPGDRLLEIGCATGTATLPLAQRGFRLTCVELGPELAAVARRTLADYPDVTIVTAAFETWRPPVPASFDLIFAATAWHWIDRRTRYQRVWDLLRPGGYFAYWSAVHVVPENGDPFFADIQEVYDHIGAGNPGSWVPLRPGHLPDDRAEINATGLFAVSAVRQFDWEISYDATQYLGLLETFSSHIALQSWQRDHLYGEVRRRVAQRADGRLRRHWGAVLHVARRRDEPVEATDSASVRYQ